MNFFKHDFVIPMSYFVQICIMIPLIVYLVLYLMHENIQLWLGAKCNRNFIIDIDKWIFGDSLYTSIKYLQCIFFDIIFAILYLFHFILPFTFSIYLILTSKQEKFSQFILSFGIVCCISTFLQYIVPTAPPWMLAKMPKEGNFARFDEFMNIKLFNTIYSASPLVCGSFPSLHVAWPTIILFTEPWIGRMFCWLHILLIAVAAVYSMHHYVIDLVFGVFLAWFGCQIGKLSLSAIKVKNQPDGKLKKNFNSIELYNIA